MKIVPLDTLKEKIARPGFDKKLEPLLHFRGSANLGRVHRFWNMTVAMLEAECETIGQGIHHFWGVGEQSHLCEPPTRPQNVSYYGFLSRLQAAPKVAALIPGLHDYARHLMPRPFSLMPVSKTAHRRGHAWWREYKAPAQSRAWVAPKPSDLKTSQIVYPFLIHDGGRPEHDMLRAINAVVPKYLSPDLRADICQDMCVAILCGDLSMDNLKDGAKAATKEMRRLFPDKYGHVSLDAPLTGDGDFSVMDTLSMEDGLWEKT